MNVKPTNIEGLLEIKNTFDFDNRGFSNKAFSRELFKKFGIDFDVKEIYFSGSKKDVIRGMHIQTNPYGQKKIVTVIKGRIIDVVLDLRPHSPTYKKYAVFMLTEGSETGLYIPEGCAHGFLALENSIVAYAIDGVYSREHDKGVRWDSIGYDWRIGEPILSQKDELLEDMALFCKKMEEIQDGE